MCKNSSKSRLQESTESCFTVYSIRKNSSNQLLTAGVTWFGFKTNETMQYNKIKSIKVSEMTLSLQEWKMLWERERQLVERR